MSGPRGGLVSGAPEVLHTARLVGERVRADDLDDLARMYADARVMATLSADGRRWARPRTAELLDTYVAHWHTHGFGVWTFREPSDGAYVGRAGLRVLSADHPVELLYAVRSPRWGRGYATEMCARILEIAFGSLRFDALAAFVLPRNRRSRRVLDKCGFREDGLIEHAGLEHLLYRLERHQGASGHSTGSTRRSDRLT